MSSRYRGRMCKLKPARRFLIHPSLGLLHAFDQLLGYLVSIDQPRVQFVSPVFNQLSVYFSLPATCQFVKLTLVISASRVHSTSFRVLARVGLASSVDLDQPSVALPASIKALDLKANDAIPAMIEKLPCLRKGFIACSSESKDKRLRTLFLRSPNLSGTLLGSKWN